MNRRLVSHSGGTGMPSSKCLGSPASWLPLVPPPGLGLARAAFFFSPQGDFAE